MSTFSSRFLQKLQLPQQQQGVAAVNTGDSSALLSNKLVAQQAQWSILDAAAVLGRHEGLCTMYLLHSHDHVTKPEA